MDNKKYKEFAEGSFVHIYNRGNNKERIFFDEQDYKAFLFRIALVLGYNQEELKNEMLTMPYSRIRVEPSRINTFKIHSFCLMPNHFHLIVEQCKDKSLSKLMSSICISYSMYINKKYKRVGHLFQDRFKSNIIEDDAQLMWTSAYIHMNPVKDGIVKSPEKYKWSSYNDYVEERNLPIVTKDLLLDLFGDKNVFKEETLNYNKKDDFEESDFMSRVGFDIDYDA
ncbi:MAG: transposase [Candidatus Paceibacterota bacterium]|jgi:REP element-mobilizing transposase RayT